MKISKKQVYGIFVLASLAIFNGAWSMSSDSAELKASAKAFYNGAEQCVYDVRDKRLHFKSSNNCRSLETLYLSYLRQGGMYEKDVSDATKLIVMSAFKEAWMARAISEDRSASIW